MQTESKSNFKLNFFKREGIKKKVYKSIRAFSTLSSFLINLLEIYLKLPVKKF